MEHKGKQQSRASAHSGAFEDWYEACLFCGDPRAGFSRWRLGTPSVSMTAQTKRRSDSEAPRSGLAVDLGPPPPDADKQEPPVLKKLRRFAFKSVADELEDPAQDEQSQGIHPKAVNEERCGKDRDRYEDGRDAKRVTGSIHGMLVARRILRDPLLVGAIA